MDTNRNFGRRQPDPERPSLPWTGRETEAACDLAFAELVHNLPMWIETDGRVDAPMLLVAIGAAAGMAAQMAITAGWADKLIDRGDDYHEMTLGDGRKIADGRIFSEMIFARETAREDHAIGSTLAKESQRHGVSWQDMPVSLFSEDVWERIGTPEESRPQAPAEHRPTLTARDLLPALWPCVRVVLTQSYPDVPRPSGPVSVHLWPAVTAQAARVLYARTIPLVPARVGAIIAIQSAVWASRQEPWPFDPELCRRRDLGLRAFDI
jgi:hypothetical protein